MPVNFAKVDAPLAASLERIGEDGLLSVFIRTHEPVSEREQQQLMEVGVSSASLGTRMITAALCPEAVRKLSQEPWVRAISLSQPLRPVQTPSTRTP
jgi:hypothetical protein